MGARHQMAAGCALAALAVGCAIDARDLEAFRETAAGPAKLQVVLRDEARPAALRAQAALCLLDLERRDLEGGALLVASFAELDPASRRALLPTLEHGFELRLTTMRGASPSARAVRAKDTGVRLLALLEPEDRARLGGKLLRWMGGDLARRADLGRYSLEELSALLGPAGAGPNSDGLTPGIATAALERLLDSLAEHADQATRAEAAAKLVAVEQSYRELPAHREDVVRHALPALGRFADAPRARLRLLEVAADPAGTATERTVALDLLAGHVTQEDLGTLAGVALDEAAPLSVRELAIARLGETRTREAVPTLLTLAGHAAARTLRQPAGELVIELGGERGLAALLRVLPSHWNTRYARDEIAAYAARVSRLPQTSYLTTLLGKRLYAPSPWSRVLAIGYFADAKDILDATRRLRLHVDDTQEIMGEGWPEKWTVGREAQAALQRVASR